MSGSPSRVPRAVSRGPVGGGRLSRGDGHLPDADLVVRVAGEQGLAVAGPGQRETLRQVALGRAVHHLRLQLLHHLLTLQILHRRGRSHGQTENNILGSSTICLPSRSCTGEGDHMVRQRTTYWAPPPSAYPPDPAQEREITWSDREQHTGLLHHLLTLQILHRRGRSHGQTQNILGSSTICLPSRSCRDGIRDVSKVGNYSKDYSIESFSQLISFEAQCAYRHVHCAKCSTNRYSRVTTACHGGLCRLEETLHLSSFFENIVNNFHHSFSLSFHQY